jgi:hypothetical protein
MSGIALFDLNRRHALGLAALSAFSAAGPAAACTVDTGPRPFKANLYAQRRRLARFERFVSILGSKRYENASSLENRAQLAAVLSPEVDANSLPSLYKINEAAAVGGWVIALAEVFVNASSSDECNGSYHVRRLLKVEFDASDRVSGVEEI